MARPRKGQSKLDGAGHVEEPIRSDFDHFDAVVANVRLRSASHDVCLSVAAAISASMSIVIPENSIRRGFTR
jgi:hypothetical protein